MKSGSLPFLITLALFAAAPHAGATAARVDVLGQPSLLPDRQLDLQQVPATIHDLGGAFLFGDASLIWNRDTSDTNAVAGHNSLKSAFGSAEYATTESRFPYAVRYSPFYFEERSGAGPLWSSRRDKDIEGLRAVIGLAGWAALSGTHNEVSSRVDGTAQTLVSKGGRNGLQASALLGEKGKRRLALGLEGRMGSWRNSVAGADVSDVDDQGFTLRAVPEFPTASGALWRFLLEGRSDRTKAVAITSDYLIEREMSVSAGAGWTRSTGPGTLWHTSLLYTTSLSKQTERQGGAGAVAIHEKFADRNGSLRLGLEQAVGRFLVTRIGVDVLTYDFFRFYTNDQGAREGGSGLTFNESQSVGLGIRPNDKLTVDVSLSRVSSNAFNTLAHEPGLIQDSHGTGTILEASVDYRF